MTSQTITIATASARTPRVRRRWHSRRGQTSAPRTSRELSRELRYEAHRQAHSRRLI